MPCFQSMDFLLLYISESHAIRRLIPFTSATCNCFNYLHDTFLKPFLLHWFLKITKIFIIYFASDSLTLLCTLLDLPPSRVTQVHFQCISLMTTEQPVLLPTIRDIIELEAFITNSAPFICPWIITLKDGDWVGMTWPCLIIFPFDHPQYLCLLHCYEVTGD